MFKILDVRRYDNDNPNRRYDAPGSVLGLDSGSLDYLGVEEEEVKQNKILGKRGFPSLSFQVRGRLLREVARRRGEQYPEDKTTKYDLDQDEFQSFLTKIFHNNLINVLIFQRRRRGQCGVQR